ncbi:uncharacterized protein LOC124201058 isoform X3 [Daphnia pulex]|uniref:uncharacterized protein LOC124201058 isoform X3 n=1 Tax=Daphnia pulex TaxID=6669 RepID=UPI001EDCD6BD|nr:uncharacterized protein LOC124201058 isoform X3 [Daphnia pulex]
MPIEPTATSAIIHDDQYSTIKATVLASYFHISFLIIKTLAELSNMNLMHLGFAGRPGLRLYCNRSRGTCAILIIFLLIVVTEMAYKSEHASEDHHDAAGKVDDVKKDGMKFVTSRHARKAKAAHQHEKGTKHPKSKKTKQVVPKAAEAAQPKTIMKKNSITIGRELFDYLALHLRETVYDGVENYIRFMTAFLGLEELAAGAEPLMAPGMGPVVNDITWFRYPININPCRFFDSPAAAAAGNSSSRISLFISVISGPNNYERRAAIRRTWPVHLKNQTNLNHPLDVVGFGFVIGLTNDSVVQQKVKEESEQFGDILLVNMIDRYVNLSVKVASLFNWVDTYCPRVDYVLKVDDDVYVNVHNLATVLHSLTVADQSIYGRQCGGNIPDRKGGKWMTSYENWPWQKFPIYFQGAGVVIAGSAVRPILAAMQVTPYFIWDDMYLVGLCAVKAKVQLRTSNQY